MLVELDAPWLLPGTRLDVPYDGDPPEIDTVWIGDITETPDPVTKRRPSDVTTGHYVRDGFAADGVPRYRWVRAGPAK